VTAKAAADPTIIGEFRQKIVIILPDILPSVCFAAIIANFSAIAEPLYVCAR